MPHFIIIIRKINGIRVKIIEKRKEIKSRIIRRIKARIIEYFIKKIKRNIIRIWGKKQDYYALNIKN